MRITIEGYDEEIREVMPDGWCPNIEIDILVGGRARVFIPTKMGTLSVSNTNTLYLEEMVKVKTKQEIKAEEAVKAALQR